MALLFAVILLAAAYLAGTDRPRAAEAAGPDDAGPPAPTPAELDQARDWLRHNPPDGANRDARRHMMAAIQAACDELEPQTYVDYVAAVDEGREEAATLERERPALYYLHAAIDKALEDIRATEVEHGVALWLIYNMGYVVKTPDTCFAIDISMPKAERLAGDLDFLLVTHSHRDHQSPRLLDAMIAAGKPVVTNWRPDSRLVAGPTELGFGTVRVKVDIGDHHQEQPDGRNNMLMYQIDCGEAADHFTIYDSGDGNNYRKMHPDRRPDVFIVHVQVGMSVEEAAAYLDTSMTLVSHVMELGHSPRPPNAWRWSYGYAYSMLAHIPPDRVAVLTWGERWLAPGTLIPGGA